MSAEHGPEPVAGRRAGARGTTRTWRLGFLGTGASGGTPGEGRSLRRESSALLEACRRILFDVTRDFSEQCRELDGIDAAVITHAHRDACGGIAALRTWWRGRSPEPLPIYASPQTVRSLRARFRRLDHCLFVPTREGQRRQLGSLALAPVTVPHARERRYPTFAWKVTGEGRSLVYASDVARLTPSLRRAAGGANLLVIDGAMWQRRLFSHLTIDAELPELCGWPVERILLTQIGSTAPPHEELQCAVASLCPKAAPAYDGLEVRV